MASARKVPRPFTMHWGSGLVVEEASHTGQYTEPCIQLMEYEGEEGGWSIRFCYYDHQGRFQRSPMMLDKETLAGLRASLKKTPKLRALLKQLVG